MANSLPAVFQFQSNSVRTTVINNEPWFVASDVCAVLGMKNHREAIRHLDDDEKGVISNDTPGGTQQMSVISESGLYALVLRSRKPEAKPFIKWVTREVLPSIRKTGSYTAQPYSVNPGDTLAKEQGDMLRGMLTDAAEKHFPGDTKKQGVLIQQGWSKLKSHFKVSYRQIPQAEFTEAVSLLSRHISEHSVQMPAFDPSSLLNHRFITTFRKDAVTGELLPTFEAMPSNPVIPNLEAPSAVPKGDVSRAIIDPSHFLRSAINYSASVSGIRPSVIREHAQKWAAKTFGRNNLRGLSKPECELLAQKMHDSLATILEFKEDADAEINRRLSAIYA